MYSLKAVQYESRKLLRSPPAISLTRFDARRADFVQSFGLAITLNRGAGIESPIFQSSISIAKNENSSVVLLFSQSTAAR